MLATVYICLSSEWRLNKAAVAAEGRKAALERLQDIAQSYVGQRFSWNETR